MIHMYMYYRTVDMNYAVKSPLAFIFDFGVYMYMFNYALCTHTVYDAAAVAYERTCLQHAVTTEAAVVKY